MTISPTGNKTPFLQPEQAKKEKAFSFVEVMVTIGVLSLGLVFVYKAFFLSLDYLHHLNCRFYAVNLLDSRIARLQKILELRKDLSQEKQEKSEAVVIDRRRVDFAFHYGFRSVDAIPNLYRVDASLSWREGAKDVKLVRSAYLTAYNPVKK